MLDSLITSQKIVENSKIALNFPKSVQDRFTALVTVLFFKGERGLVGFGGKSTRKKKNHF